MRHIDSTGTGMSSTGRPYYFESTDGVATSMTLQAAKADRFNAVYGLIISVDTAGTYVLKSGTETLMTFVFAAGGGIASPSLWPMFWAGVGRNEDLTLSKPAGAKVYVNAVLAQG